MKRKKSIIFLILLLLMGMVGTTYAYFTYSKTFDNEFNVGNFNVVIEENFDDNSILGYVEYDQENHKHIYNYEVTKEVFVVNKENVPAIVRISYNEEIIDDRLNDNTYRDLTSSYNLNYDYNLDDNIDYEISTNANYYVHKIWTQDFLDNWYFYNGWYYYLKVLPAGESVQVLDSITTYYESIDGTYNLDFNIEAVQATSDAVKELWDKEVEISDDGTVELKFLK